MPDRVIKNIQKGCIIYSIMTNENYSDYQYNRCSSRGICSINPMTASLQEIIFINLKHAADCWLKVKESGKNDTRIQNLVLNTLSVLSSNYEISKTNFEMINSAFKTELSSMKNEPGEICLNEESPFCKNNAELKDYIRYGEKEFNKRVQAFSAEERSLLKILFFLIKSLCINILTYNNFEQDTETEITALFKALNLLNKSGVKKEEIKITISDISEKDCNLMKKIREIQEEFYGKQEEAEVSFSTDKGKAVLVVGSDLRELEQISEALKDKNIDIYTHDNMILAHTFPKFRELKNLKGQFGQGMESCLLDFSTFPGPIILTKHSLFNVENLYRGRLFTTDFSHSKGVIPIKNNDFSEVIKSAEESKGFKTGKKCESEKVGMSFFKTIENIKNKVKTGNFNKIILVGNYGYSKEEKEYFKSFFEHAPQNILIISLFCCHQAENTVCINLMNDVYGMNMLFDSILKIFSQKIIIFFPHSDRHTLSGIIQFAKNKNTDIYIGQWNQDIIKQDISDSLKSEFGVFEMTTPKNDLKNITNTK